MRDLESSYRDGARLFACSVGRHPGEEADEDDTDDVKKPDENSTRNDSREDSLLAAAEARTHLLHRLPHSPNSTGSIESTRAETVALRSMPRRLGLDRHYDERVNDEPGRTPSISVALCTHNSALYLSPQLDSIASCGHPLRELVVSDDASSDTTIAMVLEFATRVAPTLAVRLISTDRVGGTVPNYERALRACVGDYVALTDHDDVWSAVRVGRGIAPLLETTAPALSFSDARIIDRDGNATGASLFASIRLSRSERRSLQHGDALSVLLRRNVVTGATAIVNRPLIHIGLPVGKNWMHDEWFAILAAALGELHLVGAPLIDYRIHGANQIGITSPRPSARARRMLAPRESRYERLAERFSTLLDRLIELGASERTLTRVRQKVTFENARARYSRHRLGRLLPIARQAIAGRYWRLSSQRNLDIIRDLLQPA